MDPLDDIFADGAPQNTRAIGKFQPKAKPRPRRESSASVPSTQCQLSLDKQENRLTESCRTEKLPEKDEDSLSGVPPTDGNDRYKVVNTALEQVATTESVATMVDMHSEFTTPVDVGNWHSCFEKSAAENADIFLGLESLDDFLSQPSATVTVNPESRPSPSVHMEAQLEGEFSTSYPVSTDAENSMLSSKTPILVVSDSRGTKEANVNFPYREASIFYNNGDFHVGNASLETEETGPFSSLEILDIASELTSTAGQKTGKFQPKPKIHSQKDGSAAIPNMDVLKSASYSSYAQPFPPVSEYMDEGLIPACPSYDANGFSSQCDNNSISRQPAPGPGANEETTDALKMPESDTSIPAEHPEAVSEMPGKASLRAKSGKRKAPVGSGVSSGLPNASTSGQENGSARLLRPRANRMNTYQLVDESVEEEGVNDGEESKSPTGSFMNEHNSDDEFQVEDDSNSSKKQARKKSKPAGSQKNKTVKKRKKAKEASNQSTEEPPKKFSHSTRRKRRHVDKALLETPEDEIDFRKLPIRDLILLAEYKERISNKAATSETPPMNQSADANSTHLNEDVAFTSEQGDYSNDEQAEPALQESVTHFNYQTYMDKTPSTRWTKQDTELFYEAVQQFGSDFSMIQHLFPGRTRRQVKLKFKKEERQHPLRFREALMNRSKDNTHFQSVIERLQQFATEEKQTSNMDDSIDFTCEDEVTTEANEEVVKPEENEAGVAEELEPNANEFHSPEKSEDSEDDMYRWSNYKSEF